jgi:signal transduction histidine kinase
MALGNILGNTIRYAHQEILVSATQHEQGITIAINDDGPGYPGPMLEQGENYARSIDQATGSTGLGLYFAAQIAALHRHGERVGKISLSNGGALGGGLFCLTIP